MSSSIDSSNNLLINEGVRLFGVLRVPGKATINGFFEGELYAELVEVGPTGHLSGVTTAKDIEISGQIFKTINCSNLCSILAGGSLFGALSYKELRIEKGGSIEGTLQKVS